MTDRPRAALVLVDGVGHDQITPDRTPFLYRGMEAGNVRALRPVLGYSDAQRAVLLTGRAPSAAGYWMLYRFSDPASSPWRRLRAMAFLDRLGNGLPKSVWNLGLSKTVLKAAQKRSRYPDLNIHNIPYRALPWTRPTLTTNELSGRPFGNVSTMFGDLQARGFQYSIIKTDSFGALLRKSSVTRLLPAVLDAVSQLPAAASFVYVYIHTPDLYAHRYGLRDGRYRGEVAEADRALEAVTKALRQKLGADAAIAVVSDHGMNHTEKFADYSRLVFDRGFGRDFVAALDSTMVRLLPLRPGGADAARDSVDATGHGRWLSAEEKQSLGIDFPAEMYGEHVYLLAPGVSIFPNFHSLLRPAAMHAYHPDVPDQLAFAYFDGLEVPPASGGRPLNMWEVHPAISSHLGLR